MSEIIAKAAFRAVKSEKLNDALQRLCMLAVFHKGEVTPFSEKVTDVEERQDMIQKVRGLLELLESDTPFCGFRLQYIAVTADPDSEDPGSREIHMINTGSSTPLINFIMATHRGKSDFEIAKEGAFELSQHLFSQFGEPQGDEG